MNNISDFIFIFGAKYLYLIILVASSVWFLNQSKSRQRETFIIACVCLPLMIILFEIATHLYYNPRPFVAGDFSPLINHRADNGFPSHHMLVASALPAIIFLFDRRISVFLGVLALGVGFSRVYAGVHHLIDIAASLGIAIIAVALGSGLVKHLKKHKARILRKE